MMSICIVEYVGCVGVGFNSLCFIGYRRRPSGGFSCVSVTGQNPHRHKNKYQKIKNKNKKRKEINPLSACVGLVFSSSFFCWFFLSSVLVSFTLLGNNLSAAAAAACVYLYPNTHTQSHCCCWIALCWIYVIVYLGWRCFFLEGATDFDAPLMNTSPKMGLCEFSCVAITWRPDSRHVRVGKKEKSEPTDHLTARENQGAISTALLHHFISSLFFFVRTRLALKIMDKQHGQVVVAVSLADHLYTWAEQLKSLSKPRDPHCVVVDESDVSHHFLVVLCILLGVFSEEREREIYPNVLIICTPCNGDVHNRIGTTEKKKKKTINKWRVTGAVCWEDLVRYHTKKGPSTILFIMSSIWLVLTIKCW